MTQQTIDKIKVKKKKTIEYIDLVTMAGGGLMLLASETTRLIYVSRIDREVYLSQVFGATLLGLFLYRLWVLVNKEDK